MTIAFAVFKGFPWRKVPQYIIAQILGAFVGGLLVYAQYSPALSHFTNAFQAAGKEAAIFTPSGPAGTIALFLVPGSKIGIVFVNEFIATVIIGVAVFSVLDPSNIFISPSSAPIVIGLIYFVTILCFAPNGVALNTARDLGARFAAACIWGTDVFPSRYTALTCLTNIAGTLVGALFQTLFLADTVRPPTSGALAIHHAQTTEKEAHLQRVLTARSNGIDGLGRRLSSLNRSVTPKPNGELNHIEEKSMA
jgi:glycerol uptake facilitator-like aquaporin